MAIKDNGRRRNVIAFEIRNVNWKPEELGRLVEEVTGRRQSNATGKQ